MFEGINFSDGMGCCVVMVGLFYFSLFDLEFIEKMRYIDQFLVVAVSVGDSGVGDNGINVL